VLAKEIVFVNVIAGQFPRGKEIREQGNFSLKIFHDGEVRFQKECAWCLHTPWW